MTELKKRKRQDDNSDVEDQNITPSPAKIQKTQVSELSPFEQVTDDVIRLEMYPFLKNQDLASLSLVSNLQRNLTEDKRAFRYEQQEREKMRIQKEIKSLVSDQKSELKKFIKIVDDIWNIPFNASSWIRPVLSESIINDSQLSDEDKDVLDDYVASKLTIKDFSVVKDWTLATNIVWTLRNTNITYVQKKQILQHQLSKKKGKQPFFNEFMDWVHLAKVRNALDRDLLAPFAKHYLKDNKNDIRTNTGYIFNNDLKYIQDLAEKRPFQNYIVE